MIKVVIEQAARLGRGAGWAKRGYLYNSCSKDTTMANKSDILVLGATGFTGRLITRYLSAHPQRPKFTLAIGARSPSKLQKLVQDLSLPSSVKLVQVDVTREEEVEVAVRGARVVINTVGPYWLWGTPVVRSCVRNGAHYVDLTAEVAWLRNIIIEFDYFATKTGSIIVPGCGFDSVPSDISAYLANKTLKSATATNGVYPGLGDSTTAFRFRGGVSGGTISSMMTLLEKVPPNALRESREPYILSPFVGQRRPLLRFLYNLPIPGTKPLKGAIFLMAAGNKAVIQRTFGLLEMQARDSKAKDAQLARYGPEFCYDEFMGTSGTMSALVFTAALIFSFGMLMVRYVAKKLLPQSGEGPSDEKMEKGWFNATNISTSATSPPVKVKSVIKGHGDGGYLLTAIMISESALCFLLPPVSESASIKSGSNDNVHTLSAIARQGGILTPMSAFGDQLIQRLEETGRFEFSSSIIDDAHKKDV
ncbi:hypothetical protein GALMADRAFT_473621 [Galerina marginata CBS 339.88]|uniref:Saccharopine dehydrogenase NADP binding domain-containing protein n=1 Tax=Galerina marginata (strain CBS 339.88) TaxID=685588 RepID=A0A067TBA7_GALM3|nr:hypothetical protein GALMADRAFT_473621 [Galerina marginata CBS 339.88]